jgi:hypothetical protein
MVLSEKLVRDQAASQCPRLASPPVEFKSTARGGASFTHAVRLELSSTVKASALTAASFTNQE